MPLPRNSRNAPSNNARFFSKENSRQMSRMSHFLTVKNCRIFLAHTLLSLLSLSPVLLRTFQFRSYSSSFSRIRNAKKEKGEHCISPFYHVDIPCAIAPASEESKSPPHLRQRTCAHPNRGEGRTKERRKTSPPSNHHFLLPFSGNRCLFCPEALLSLLGRNRLFPTHVTQHQEKKGTGKWREIKVGQDFGRRLFLPLVTTPTQILAGNYVVAS